MVFALTRSRSLLLASAMVVGCPTTLLAPVPVSIISNRLLIYRLTCHEFIQTSSVPSQSSQVPNSAVAAAERLKSPTSGSTASPIQYSTSATAGHSATATSASTGVNPRTHPSQLVGPTATTSKPSTHAALGTRYGGLRMAGTTLGLPAVAKTGWLPRLGTFGRGRSMEAVRHHPLRRRPTLDQLLLLLRVTVAPAGDSVVVKAGPVLSVANLVRLVRLRTRIIASVSKLVVLIV